MFQNTLFLATADSTCQKVSLLRLSKFLWNFAEKDAGPDSFRDALHGFIIKDDEFIPVSPENSEKFLDKPQDKADKLEVRGNKSSNHLDLSVMSLSDRHLSHLTHIWHVSGGILADEMGLGKTLTSIGLIASNPRSDYRPPHPKTMKIVEKVASSGQADPDKRWEI